VRYIGWIWLARSAGCFPYNLADFVLFKFRVPFDFADEDGGREGWDCGAALLRIEARLTRGGVVGVLLHGVQVQGLALQTNWSR
jgi:hypothetical protein